MFVTIIRSGEVEAVLSLFQAKSSHHPAAKSLLIVYVDDINDNGPKFVQSAYYKEVNENSDIGTTVLRVSATDADAEVCRLDFLSEKYVQSYKNPMMYIRLSIFKPLSNLCSYIQS